MAVKWNDDWNPLADIAAMKKFMIEACQICGGSRWEYRRLNEYPYIKVVRCSFCNGTGKLKQYQNIEELTNDNPG